MLKCKMCARNTNEVKPSFMSHEVYSKISKYFKSKMVEFMGLGESLLHPELFKFIDEAYARGGGEIGILHHEWIAPD